MMSTWPYTREVWFTLPLRLRQRWWRETDYSRLSPSLELLNAIAEAIK